MFVTYEMSQDVGGSVVLKGAKEAEVAGTLVRFEVGEFENASGRKTYGVRIHASAGSELVELPANARNVAVHERLPEEFRDALKNAA